MTNDPHPVTFHMRAEYRPELVSRRPGSRPHRTILHAALVVGVLGTGFGYLAADRDRLLPRLVAFAPAAKAPAAAPRQQAAAIAPPRSTASRVEADRTPVGSIARAPQPHAAPRAGFAPLERAPGYSGFAVTAGR